MSNRIDRAREMLKLFEEAHEVDKIEAVETFNLFLSFVLPYLGKDCRGWAINQCIYELDEWLDEQHPEPVGEA